MEAEWYASVAARLLQDRLLLTALELHTELVEAGREEPQLREFFSNPANFERPQPHIVRCPSQATLDSLDLTRLSEDSERSDDVAILEFELRKAKETINSLRANLTQAAECDASSIDLGYERTLNEDPIKPHERRALNFLIYEYLLQQDCKLTSITFSDEVQDQDFECWDDVGLNIPRPAGLISIYRGESLNQSSKNQCHRDIQTEELVGSESSFQVLADDKSVDIIDANTLNENEEIAYLKKQILALETDKVNYQKLYDAALASLNSLTSPTSDVPSSETTLYNREDSSVEMLQSGSLGVNYSCDVDNIDDEMQPLPQTATQNYYGSSVSTNSLTPDQFEMIDSDKNGGSSHKDESNVSSFEPAIMLEDQIMSSPISMQDPSSKRKASVTTLDDTISFNDHPESDWERDQIPRMQKNSNPEGKNEAWINSDLHNEYKSALMKFCDVQYTKDNAFFKDIPSVDHPISLQRFVCVVSATLPKIIPNILLVKRDEVISLLICAIFLHPDQSQRDKLLQLLLNFKKKMEKEDRALIISGLVLLLQWNAEMNCGLDSDLLGFFWEMLNSKSVEKRLLGAEASVALAPYISMDLVNSLLLSMVLSMCDSSDSLIRKQGLLGALFICPTATSTKYSQIENIFFNLALGNDIVLSNICIETFAPVLARSTLLNGIFHSEFYPHILEKLEYALTNGGKLENTVILLKIMNSLVLFALFYVIDVDIIKLSKIEQIDNNECDSHILDYLYNKPFHNPKYLMADDSINPFQLIEAFYNITGSDLNMAWYEKDWFINSWLKKILNLLMNSQDLNERVVNAFIDLFENTCLMFGFNFTNNIFKPMIEEELNKIEQKIIKPESRNKYGLVLISIYLGILSKSNSNEQENLGNIINRWCICCGMFSISTQILGIPLVRYSTMKSQLFGVALTAMWQCVVHSSEQVRSFVTRLFTYLVQFASLTDDVLNSSVVPAIITLVNDSAVGVKCNAVVSLGEVVSRPNLSSAAHDKCWVTLEGLVMEEKSTGALGALITTCIARTLLKILKIGNTHVNKVLPNLVMLCYSHVFSADNISAINDLLGELLPALQLATHMEISEQFTQYSLLPAIRKLECLDHHILSEYRSAIESLLHKITLNDQNKEHHSSGSSHHIASLQGHTLPAIIANSESMGRRVTQMFQQSKPAMNLQNIFKKK